MGDFFQMLVDADATLDEADGVAAAVIDRFRQLGLIAGEADSDCVLDGTGYRPGPAAIAGYKLGPREHPFWEWWTCGVSPIVGRSFNPWAIGPSCDGFICPACRAVFGPDDPTLCDAIFAGADEWACESGPALVPCPTCLEKRPITQWQCKPPFGFGNVSFKFWNWPPLDSPAWKIDIAGIVREVTGHTVVRTYGKL